LLLYIVAVGGSGGNVDGGVVRSSGGVGGS